MTKTRRHPLLRFALLALASAAFILPGRAALEAQAASAPLRVLTFNILGSKPSTEKNAKCQPWVQRKPIVLEVMSDRTDGIPYDFIGTQETSVNPDPELHQVNHLAAEMSGYGSLYAATSGEKNTVKPKEISMSNMIFWRKDRWEIDRRDQGTFWLSDTPEVPGSNQWAPKGRGAKRNVTYGLFHEIVNGKRTGKKVYFYNTHLNVHVPDARVKSALLIMERIRTRYAQSAPVIVTGDFNSLRNNSRGDGNVYKYLTGNPIDFENERHQPSFALTEVFDAVHPDSPKKPRIDFIFFGAGLRARSAVSIDHRHGTVRASDHNAVGALLDWQ